jgi:hypothetical protein
MKCTVLKKAAFNHGELSAVDSANKVLAAQTGKQATCESCCALLLSRAQQTDGKLKHKGRDTKRQVNFADAHGFVDGLTDGDDCDLCHLCSPSKTSETFNQTVEAGLPGLASAEQVEF